MIISRHIAFRLIAVCLVSAVVLSGAAAAVSVNATAGVEYETASGLTVVAGENHTVYSGAFDPPDSVSVNNVTFSASGDATITADDFVGVDTELSSIDATNADITINPDDKVKTTVGGGVTSLSYGDISLDDGAADLTYSASSDGTVGVGGFSSGKGVVAVNASTGAVVGSTTVGSDGVAAIPVDAGSGSLQLQSTPSELEIRDELDQSLITSVNSTIEFYPQGELETVITRDVTNGSVDMSGLPKDEPFIAVASASGYSDRRIFVDSLIETRDVYLLPNTADTVNIEFEIEDFSGKFDKSDTVLQIERSINSEWTPVEGDFFGGTGRFDSTLKRNQRHRLTLTNVKTGETRRLGQFTPQISGVQTVTIKPTGGVELGEATELVTLEPPLKSIEASSAASFGVEIQEGETAIQKYNINISHVAPNGSTTQLTQRSGSGGGAERFALNLTGLNGSVQADVDWTLADGATRSTTLERSIRAYYPGGSGLLDGIGQISTEIDAGGQSGPSSASTFISFILALLITVGVATSNRSSPEVTGMASLGSLVGFQVIGWLAAEVLFASAIAFTVLLVLRRRL